FVSYLEHRGIAGETYRRDHDVESLFTLVGRGDVAGVSRLLDRLKTDFNGDLFEPGAKTELFWNKLPAAAISRLHAFLRRVDLVSDQQDFWKYDFRFIPVELISGIYESFLADDKRDVGAYYTPRHLAMLVVDLALSKSTNLLSERIYDGACGSGILLTTAYRRLLGKAEAQAGRTLGFAERVNLLKSSIFGSDLNLSACRVTAFSLYLSVLEGLDPSDLAILTAQGSSHLPKLVGHNLQGGAEGDFFSQANPRFKTPDCSIFLSNPPWVEPKKNVVLSSDTWAKAKGFDIPRRQTAGAFILRALECVTPSATLCFILPVSILAAPSSRAFMREVLARYEIETLINFGDVRKLLFAAARQPCVVMV
ncbi:HsdM family class I SAM-dependent methyltransferase, partial [Arenimonas metalli]